MSYMFCCDSIKPYQPQYLMQQEKFNTFMAWVYLPQSAPTASEADSRMSFTNVGPPFAIHLVCQVKYGPLESKGYIFRSCPSLS